MKTYLITYDLNSPGQNYEDLYETIKSFGDWAHYLTSTWFVYTSLDKKEMSERITSQTDSNDSHVIIPVSDYYGRADNELWDWLQERV
ncbi:hypothetical protein [Virgibacillus kimchii]